MRFLLAIILVLVIVAGGAWALGLINIQQTQVAKLPELKTEGGQMPAFDVKTARIEVGTTNSTVEVPKVVTETKTITTPHIEVKKPE